MGDLPERRPSLADIANRAAVFQAGTGLHRFEAVALADILALAFIGTGLAIRIALAAVNAVAMDRIVG